ncbi:MAG: helicase-related protein, partial [Betaproteobacteria bacterium]
MTDAKKRLHSLKQQIGESLCKDQWSFHRTFRSLESGLKTNGDLKGLEQLESKVKLSSERARARAARIPAVSFPVDLPVSALADEIEGLIAANQVVIISGETGSGKTTQIPKILMKLGRGSRGQIVHTQPRRIAARSVANRLAQETGTELGDIIGYQVRFNDRSSSENLIKVVTDGILIAETQTDRFLSAYDSIIIDEAHERNLNIDFLFGYLKNILPKRPELKIVITSATIDAEKFSKHFNDAPVIKVSGRLYPVDILYEDSLTKEGEQLPVEEYGLVTMALRRISEHKGSGDVLVFLPGEREIRQVDTVIRKDFLRGSVDKNWEILTLFSRLSVREQNKVFGPSHKRRIILSTNVAETSLTIPRIQFVIDSGEARLKRYSYRNKVEMLQVERISKAAADQRAGRAGRLMHGVCFRLYSLEDFQKRSEFTDPEILRSSLASVILRMQYLRLGDPQEFPFVDL